MAALFGVALEGRCFSGSCARYHRSRLVERAHDWKGAVHSTNAIIIAVIVIMLTLWTRLSAPLLIALGAVGGALMLR